MNDQINVLFVCSGNSANSITAEIILNHTGKGRFQAFSAGMRPETQINPFAAEQLMRANLPTEGLKSKSWDVFTASDAPALDFVFSVCEEDFEENYPVWPGQPMTARWCVEDPVLVEGDEEHRRQAFSKAFTQINWRISIFTNLPLSNLSKMALKRKLETISHLKDRRASPRPVFPIVRCNTATGA